jgi:subtilisin family serine protease
VCTNKLKGKIAMKKIIIISALLFSVPASADMVITFKQGVSEIPASVRKLLEGRSYEFKSVWSEPRLTLQNLPKDVWQQALRQPAMAVLLRGDLQLESALPESVERIEENASLEQVWAQDRYKFDPVKCDGVIYGFGHYSTAVQKLSAQAPCDNFALRPRGDARYRVEVESDTPKTIEVYEHGDLIVSGTKQVEVDFTFGYRQKYLIVKGAAGQYRVSVYPVGSNVRKDKLYNFVLADDYSNAYGFGIPNLAKIHTGAPGKAKWIGADMMSAQNFWQKGFTGKGIKVAVVDTGIDAQHPFLKDHIVGGFSPISKGTSVADYQDEQGHGTHVAGIIRQVAPDAQLLAVRVFPNEGEGGESATLETVEAGIRWAIDNGAQVINLSLGGDSAPASFRKVFEYGASKGVLFAIASGNGRAYEPMIPAAYAGVVAGLGFSVGATDQYGSMAVFSNYSGNNLNMKHVASHGQSVLSAAVGEQGFVSMSGTSMAAPQIAGLLALVRQANPSLGNVELQTLVSKAVERGAVND